MTIPRLELCGAVLAARLHEVFVRETDLKIDQVFFWCDSMTVLGYIRNTTSRYKSFVANRLAVIHDLTEVGQWRHVDGTSNPADLATRGITPTDVDLLDLWLHGPKLLLESIYPKANEKCWKQDEIGEEEEKAADVMVTSKLEHFINLLIHRCSTWSKTRNVLRYVIKFVSMLKGSRTSLEIETEAT